MSQLFVTGATGFIGKRLVARLLEEGHTVYALCRGRGRKLGSLSHPRLFIVDGDLKQIEKMDPLPKSLDAAYYLVHSMSQKLKNLQEKEEQLAKNFVSLIDQTDCKQVIYLSGMIEPGRELSEHLSSRKNVEEVLKEAKAALTVFRASVIIGSGGASFEIIRDLVEKLPVMIAPRWVRSLCQPIAIKDVLFYLQKALHHPDLYHQTLDIGGPEVMSFKELLLRYAKFRGLRRFIFDIPFLTPTLSSYWLVLISSVRFSLCSYLVESMKTNSVCRDLRIQELIPHECLSFEKALERAFLRIEKNEVASTWMDAWFSDEESPDLVKFSEVPLEGCFREVQKASFQGTREQAMKRVWSVGGDHGWYGMDWAWKLRGMIDKMFHGPGMNRGRRHPTDLVEGDSVDFWRVVKADRATGDLILYAQMHLPGEAWLQFKVEEHTLYQIVVFRPKGVLGRLYWYAMFPFHYFIFRKMLRGCLQSCTKRRK